MARLVRFERTGPIRIDPQDKPVFVCGCGLTNNFPFCDGSHKTCRDESPDAVYIYTADGRRIAQSEGTGRTRDDTDAAASENDNPGRSDDGT